MNNIKNSDKIVIKNYIIDQKKLNKIMIVLSIASILLSIIAKHLYTLSPHAWYETGLSTIFSFLQLLVVFAALILAKIYYGLDIKIGTNTKNFNRLVAISRIVIPLVTIIYGLIFWFHLYLTPVTCFIFMLYEFNGNDK